jgi:hypothetical protein
MRRIIGSDMARSIWIGIAALLFATGAQAVSETCREWQDEHAEWKARVVALALTDMPRRAIDEAMFELVQREAYLTSCPARVDAQQPYMVGWRLVGRSVDEYPAAVLESVLEAGGFDLDLRRRFHPVLHTARRGS